MKVLYDYSWRPTPYDDRLNDLFEKWKDTPYIEGQQRAGSGVDCFRFVCAVLDGMEHTKRTVEHIPADRSIHDRRGAFRGFKRVLERFKPFEVVKDKVLEAGDVLISGPKGGGPGHALIAGSKPLTLWHVPGVGLRVRRIGMALSQGQLFRIYRTSNKDLRWVQQLLSS